jgi:hypothetical protein
VPAPPAAQTTPAAAATPAATEPAAGSKASRSRRRRSEPETGEEPKADPLHRKIPIPAEPTPAELKNPFGAAP